MVKGGARGATGVADDCAGMSSDAANNPSPISSARTHPVAKPRITIPLLP
jgi:hypothetical protein